MMKDDLDHHFSLANLPYGIASIDEDGILYEPQCATRIHGTVVFLGQLAQAGTFAHIKHDLNHTFHQSSLNELAALVKEIQTAIRKTLQDLFKKGIAQLPQGAAFPVSGVKMHLPLRINDFTDFSVSIEHNLRAGEIVVGKKTLSPGFAHFPLGYGGRCSSIMVSGTPIIRPVGQFVKGKNDDGSSNVVLGPSEALDYELELGVVVGKPVPKGQRLMAKDADEHIFGFVLVNDWSARDIQTLEMPPLGPLNGKNFGTSISPWVVTSEALQPFRVPSPLHDKLPASYLRDDDNGNYDISVQVEVISKDSSTVTCRTKTKDSLYWNFRQLLAHQAIGGCGLATGDLLASGTVSGRGEDERGCLLESTWGGQKTMTMSDGRKMSYLRDGDVVRMTAMAGGDGEDAVGFGECRGMVEAAVLLD